MIGDARNAACFATLGVESAFAAAVFAMLAINGDFADALSVFAIGIDFAGVTFSDLCFGSGLDSSGILKSTRASCGPDSTTLELIRLRIRYSETARSVSGGKQFSHWLRIVNR